MNILLIFFAIPLATIILSIIFETLIQCPIKVAGIAFSIFIIVAFALGGTAVLIVAAIVYTIISFITAFITMIIRNRKDNNRCNYIYNDNWYNSSNSNFDNNNFQNLNTFNDNNFNNNDNNNNNLFNNSIRSSCRRYN